MNVEKSFVEYFFLLARHVSVQKPGQFHHTLAKVVQLISALQGTFSTMRGTGFLEISVGKTEEPEEVME